MPWARLSISGVESGTNPETPPKRSQTQSKFWISRFCMVGDPQTLKNEACSVPKRVSELCYPQHGWYSFSFWSRPLHTKQSELVMKFLTVPGRLWPFPTHYWNPLQGTFWCKAPSKNPSENPCWKRQKVGLPRIRALWFMTAKRAPVSEAAGWPVRCPLRWPVSFF